MTHTEKRAREILKTVGRTGSSDDWLRVTMAGLDARADEVRPMCMHTGCDNRVCIGQQCRTEHGCGLCGGVILADAEDMKPPLCDDCYRSHVRHADDVLRKAVARVYGKKRIKALSEHSEGWNDGIEQAAGAVDSLIKGDG